MLTQQLLRKRVIPSLARLSSTTLERSPFEQPKTFIDIRLVDKPGSLHQAIGIFAKYGVSISRIESHPSNDMSKTASFQIDFEGSPGCSSLVDQCLLELRLNSLEVSFPGDRDVPWFPMIARDLDFTVDTLDGGTDLINDDHPGFTDEDYKARRNLLAESAKSYRHGQPIPRIDYSRDEVATWSHVYSQLQALHKQHACKEYLRIMPYLEQHCGFRIDNIPQLDDVSSLLQETTGFSIRPIAGLLSARDFLNALAFRVFYSTQYIRHHSRPLYTPEPDLIHELIGHAPLFADPDFAAFSHAIGVASLGASDADIERLASCYWFSVEFGLVWEGDQVKAYGAGLLSSFGELEYACSPTRPAGGVNEVPELRPFDPWVAGNQAFPITNYQPVYFVANDLATAKENMIQFCESLNRPFHAKYDPLTRRMHVDRAIKRLDKSQAKANLEQQAFFDTQQAKKRAREDKLRLHTRSLKDTLPELDP
jgi:phenylalanine-4-hydroxylase